MAHWCLPTQSLQMRELVECLNEGVNIIYMSTFSLDCDTTYYKCSYIVYFVVVVVVMFVHAVMMQV